MKSAVIYSITMFFICSCTMNPIGNERRSVLRFDNSSVDSTQIVSWEIFLYDGTTSLPVLHEARSLGEEDFDAFVFNVVPNHSYGMDVFVNQKEKYHSSSAFVRRMTATANVLPGAAHLMVSSLGDFQCAPLIIFDVMRVSVEKFTNHLTNMEDIVIEEVYLASAAVSGDYELENTDGYSDSPYPQISQVCCVSVPFGETFPYSVSLYSYPFLDDAPQDVVTSLVFKTSHGYYYYPLPRNVGLSSLGSGMSLAIREVIFRALGGTTPFEQRVEVVLDDVSVESRPIEDPVVVKL